MLKFILLFGFEWSFMNSMNTITSVSSYSLVRLIIALIVCLSSNVLNLLLKPACSGGWVTSSVFCILLMMNFVNIFWITGSIHIGFYFLISSLLSSSWISMISYFRVEFSRFIFELTVVVILCLYNVISVIPEETLVTYSILVFHFLLIRKPCPLHLPVGVPW